MFHTLASLSNTKNWKEALGFFTIHVVVGYIILIVVGIITTTAVLSGTINLEGQGGAIGSGLATLIWLIYSLILNCALLIKKRLYKNVWYVILAILSLAVNGAGIAVAAFLTTRNTEFAQTDADQQIFVK